MQATRRIRALLATTATIALAAGALGAATTAALADQPAEIVVHDTWEERNPCTGMVTMTSTHLLRLHLHDPDSNVVAIWDGHLETADGYVGNSADTAVYTARHMVEHVSWIASNPETGGKFQIRIRIKMDLATGEFQHDDWTFRCIREPS